VSQGKEIVFIIWSSREVRRYSTKSYLFSVSQS